MKAKKKRKTASEAEQYWKILQKLNKAGHIDSVNMIDHLLYDKPLKVTFPTEDAEGTLP